MTAPCYRPGHESGAWFELKCIWDNIALKETSGHKATREREIYQNWLKYPEYKKADKENREEGLYGNLLVLQNSPEQCQKEISEGLYTTPIYETSPEAIITPPEIHKRGRPRKASDQVISRATAWRRKQENQGVLL